MREVDPAATDPPLQADDAVTRQWRALLTGGYPTLRHIRRFWRHVPAPPRCKVCASPTHRVGGAVGRLFWHGPLRDVVGQPLTLH
jgi:hypothetical protein